jgi:hypothetical protein
VTAVQPGAQYQHVCRLPACRIVWAAITSLPLASCWAVPLVLHVRWSAVASPRLCLQVSASLAAQVRAGPLLAHMQQCGASSERWHLSDDSSPVSIADAHSALGSAARWQLKQQGHMHGARGKPCSLLLLYMSAVPADCAQYTGGLTGVYVGCSIIVLQLLSPLSPSTLRSCCLHPAARQ